MIEYILQSPNLLLFIQVLSTIISACFVFLILTPHKDAAIITVIFILGACFMPQPVPIVLLPTLAFILCLRWLEQE